MLELQVRTTLITCNDFLYNRSTIFKQKCSISVKDKYWQAFANENQRYLKPNDVSVTPCHYLKYASFFPLLFSSSFRFPLVFFLRFRWIYVSYIVLLYVCTTSLPRSMISQPFPSEGKEGGKMRSPGDEVTLRSTWTFVRSAIKRQLTCEKVQTWYILHPAATEFANKLCTCLVLESSCSVRVTLTWDSKADTCRLQTQKATGVSQSGPPDPTLHQYALQARHWGFPNLKKIKNKKSKGHLDYWVYYVTALYLEQDLFPTRDTSEIGPEKFHSNNVTLQRSEPYPWLVTGTLNHRVTTNKIHNIYPCRVTTPEWDFLGQISLVFFGRGVKESRQFAPEIDLFLYKAGLYWLSLFLYWCF